MEKKKKIRTVTWPRTNLLSRKIYESFFHLRYVDTSTSALRYLLELRAGGSE